MQQLEGRSVLIVDDDSRNIFALGSYLEQLNIRVTPAYSGAEALEILKNGRPEVEIVLMDMMMPEMDGFEAIQLIRADPNLQEIPVISVTASAMKGDREKCLAAGASEYVSKPVNLQELVDKMVELLAEK